MGDPHFYPVQRYQAAETAAHNRDMAIEQRAQDITGEELKAKAYEILTALDRYASDRPEGWEARGLLNALMEWDKPQLARGQVWCRKCGNTMKVDGADCLRHGWPECCGETMTIDSPEEQQRTL